ncbi:HP1 family phage holin [Salinivibrio sp. KP-1]|uniref:HP1 family phage holin n=2 Tax=Vibrionaceae TaxID=641 RepID=UPI0006976D7F|nr:HP1 family phage holin [Salinivibrio sp. KP-1]
MNDLFDKVTGYLTYFFSALGMVIGGLSLEQWYFLSSIIIGLAMFISNQWHKREMRKIAREKGIILERDRD